MHMSWELLPHGPFGIPEGGALTPPCPLGNCGPQTPDPIPPDPGLCASQHPRIPDSLHPRTPGPWTPRPVASRGAPAPRTLCSGRRDERRFSESRVLSLILLIRPLFIGALLIELLLIGAKLLGAQLIEPHFAGDLGLGIIKFDLYSKNIRVA